VAKPDTILAWHRRFIAHKFDGSQSRSDSGRPRISAVVVELVVRLPRENLGCGYDCIVRVLANLGHQISDQTVGNTAPQRLRTSSQAKSNDFEGLHPPTHGRARRN
jgi:hypothetical protein